MSTQIQITSSVAAAGITGQIQFNNGGAFGADSALFWDNTNKRLGVGANSNSPTSALFLRTNILVSNDIVTIQNGQYGNPILRVTDNVTTSQSSIGSIFIAARIYGSNSTITGNQFDLGGYGLGASYGDATTNAVWLNNQGNIGDGVGSSVISVSSNVYINLQTTKKYKFEAQTGHFGIGNVGTLGARLDVRAQGALSTDIAFRVRNSADTGNFFDIQGDGRYRLGDANGGLSNSFSYISDGRLFMAKSGGNFIEFNNSGQNRIYNPVGGWEIQGNTTLATASASGSSGSGSFYWFAGTMQVGGLVATGGASNSFWVSNGVAPSNNSADRHWYYSADIVAGNAAPHFRTENGSIIKLYQQSTGGAASIFVTNTSGILNDTATFDGYTIGQVVKALRNIGILA